MDEIDGLAYSVFDAFEGITELTLEWLIVPNDPGDRTMLRWRSSHPRYCTPAKARN